MFSVPILTLLLCADFAEVRETLESNTMCTSVNLLFRIRKYSAHFDFPFGVARFFLANSTFRKDTKVRHWYGKCGHLAPSNTCVRGFDSYKVAVFLISWLITACLGASEHEAELQGRILRGLNPRFVPQESKPM